MHSLHILGTNCSFLAQSWATNYSPSPDLHLIRPSCPPFAPGSTATPAPRPPPRPPHPRSNPHIPPTLRVRSPFHPADFTPAYKSDLWKVLITHAVFSCSSVFPEYRGGGGRGGAGGVISFTQAGQATLDWSADWRNLWLPGQGTL
jgi:hypothetical protein